MTTEDGAPTGAELREAELLADALEHQARPGRDIAPVEDALGTAWLLRASRTAELSELRARAVFEGGVAKRLTSGLRVAIAVAAAAAVVAFLAFRPRGPARLPTPDAQLLQVTVAAARTKSGTSLARLEDERAAYRERLHAALRRTYGGDPP